MAQGDQSIFSKEIQAFAGLVQALEQAINDTYNLRQLFKIVNGSAVLPSPGPNQVLDDIGDQVGIARPYGMSDTDYIPLLVAKIQMNASGGEPERLIAALKALTNTTTVNYHDYYPCLVSLEFAGTSVIDNLWTFMKRLVAAGVALRLVQVDATTPFTFDSDTLGFDNGFLGDLLQ